MPSSAVSTFTDPYSYQASIRGADYRAFVTAPGDFRAEVTRIDLHRLWMQRAWTSLPHIAYANLVKSRCIVFFLCDHHQRSTYHAGNELAPDGIVTDAIGTEHHHRTSAECAWAAMSLTPADLAAAGRALVGHDLTAPAVTRLLRPAPPLMARLRHWHAAAGHLAATLPDILVHPEIARAMEDELVRAMVACLTDGGAEGQRRPRGQPGAVMRRLERALEANEGRPLYLTELCVAVGVSGRALRSHCQEHLGMGPHRYLWLRRMNLVRRALALADPAASHITTIAMDHGFGELGRFAVSYRKLFGETPSTTLRRAPDNPTDYSGPANSGGKLPLLP